ncbi:MAG: hypothetical protein V4750_00695 [Pseudomonadota bacterium]
MPDLKVSLVKDVALASDKEAVVIKVETRLDEQPTEITIEITTDMAPGVAIALLTAASQARVARDGFGPALDVLAAAVVASGSAERVRLQLLFDTGAVLPLDMPAEAGRLLRQDLATRLRDAADSADPARS